MQSILSQRDKVIDVTYQFALQFAETQKGEDFHPNYKKDKEGFIEIIKSLILTRRGLKNYFRKLSKRVNREIDWYSYNRDLEEYLRELTNNQGFEASRIQTFKTKYKKKRYTKDVFWGNEKLKMAVIFTETLSPSYTTGGKAAQKDTKINIGVTSTDTDTIKAMQKYALDLAKSIIDETKKKVETVLYNSLIKGLSQSKAAQAIARIIQDDYRAGMIAHTESVNAYTQGKLDAGERMGAWGKEWEDGQPRACPICKSMNGQKVPLDKDFKSDVDGSTHKGSPGHPWCACLTKLVYKKP